MQLSDLSVRRPVFAAVVAILLVVIGLVGFFNLSVREYPDIDPPVVSINTTYTGAAATVVESRVTQVLEQGLSGVEGLQTITSRSRDGQSSITPRIRRRDAMSISPPTTSATGRPRGATTCPTRCQPPEVRKVDADASPIMFMVAHASRAGAASS